MKVTITIEDNDEGGASMTTAFDPPISDDDEVTPAGELACRIFEAFERVEKQSDIETKRAT